MGKPADILDKRLVNALYVDASINAGAGAVLGAAGKAGLKAVETAIGGLWVGGTAYLTPETIEFHANGLNKMVHAAGSINEVVLPLADLAEITYRKAMVTHIIDLSAGERKLSIRGYNMRSFHAAIRAAAEPAQRPSP